LFDNGASGDRLPLGLSGFTLTANSPFETASLTADTPELMFDKFYLCGLTGPGKVQLPSVTWRSWTFTHG
jgi:hypothetical protein